MNLNTYFETAKISLKNRMAYRLDFLVDMLINPFVFLIVQFIWTTIYSFNAVSVIKGFTLNETITYFAFSQIVGYFVWTWITGAVGEIIKYGEFARYALMPVDFFWSIVSEMFGGKLPSMLIKAPLLLLLLKLFFNVSLNFNPVYLLMVFASLMISFLIYSTFFFIMGLFTFWQESYFLFELLGVALLNFFSGSLLPLEFYPDFMKGIVNVLPFKHIYYSPIMIYLEKYTIMESISVLLQQLVSFFILYLIAKWVFNIGRRKFTSQGG